MKKSKPPKSMRVLQTTIGVLSEAKSIYRKIHGINNMNLITRER